MLTEKLVVDPDRRYAVKDAAKILGISRRTLDKYAKQGLIHPVMHVSGALFYQGKEIKRFYDYTI